MRKITIEFIPETDGTTHENINDHDIVKEFLGKCLSGYKWKVLPQADVIKKTLNITDVMFDLFSQFGWTVKTGSEQKSGSCADIYAEHDDEYGGYTMRIDDGNCHNELNDAVYHIYATGGKVFEGRIGTPEDFIVVMRVLGFEKKI